VRLISFLIFCLALCVMESFGQTSPLIMKHADSLAVARVRGTLLLQGRVHFVHDSVEFRTQRASWFKESEMVQCDGGFLFTHPSGYIRAQSGLYQKQKSLASATGDVNAADSAGTYKFTGEYMVYDRENEILTMPQKPKLYQFEHQQDGTIDTVAIEAKSIIYDKGESFAQAYQNVKVTQKDMIFTCDTGYFDRKNNWLSMKGNPTFDMKTYHLTGDSIFVVMDSTGKSMQSALVIRNAHGIQKEEEKKNEPGKVTEAFGDTLYAEFSGNKIERLYVNLNARGFFYETDLPDYRNLMDGDRLDLFFKKGRMDHAVVSGKAQSTYFYVKNDRSVAGKNEAAGDTINIIFDAQKNAVKSLKLLGRSTMASGRYVDMEKERRNREAREKARLDSLAKLGLDSSAVKGDTTKKELTDEERSARAMELRDKMRENIRKSKVVKHKPDSSKTAAPAPTSVKSEPAKRDSAAVKLAKSDSTKAAKPAAKTEPAKRDSAAVKPAKSAAKDSATVKPVTAKSDTTKMTSAKVEPTKKDSAAVKSAATEPATPAAKSATPVKKETKK